MAAPLSGNQEVNVIEPRPFDLSAVPSYSLGPAGTSLSAPLVFAVVAFFFFQAEDGIRDGHVTGVQTCALPISVPPAERQAAVVAAKDVRPWAGIRERGFGG